MTRLLTIASPLLLVIFFAFTDSQAEEKSMWQKFVDFFAPTPEFEGEGPLYDELRELNNKINRTEGKYSRERRPGNKTRLRKELDKLKSERESLIEKIKEEEKNGPKSAMSSSNVSSSSVQTTERSESQCTRDTVFIHDTTLVKDTVFIHDTLYVIVADKPAAEIKKDSTQESNSN